MSSSTLEYSIPARVGLSAHFPAAQPLARDTADDFLVEARVRSGDYLQTLATELDEIAKTIDAKQLPEAVDLERLATELLYVTERYELTRK